MPNTNDINATKIDSDKVTQSVDRASAMLMQGDLLAYPTESVWGIGCDAYDSQAVERILAIKQRPIAKGMIVITDEAVRLMPLLRSLNTAQRERVLASWKAQNNGDSPNRQAQTWLLPIPDSLPTTIPSWITGQHQSVAVRVIAHPLIKRLCRQLVSESNPFGFIVSTSCNPSGQLPATSLEEAYGYFGEQIGYLQAHTLGFEKPSQIRDAVTGAVIR